MANKLGHVMGLCCGIIIGKPTSTGKHGGNDMGLYGGLYREIYTGFYGTFVVEKPTIIEDSKDVSEGCRSSL